MRWLLLPMLLLVGCQSDNSYDIVRGQASDDLRCPESQIVVRYQGATPSNTCLPVDDACRDRQESAVILVAQGCGAVRTYRCDSYRDTYGTTHSTCRGQSSVQQM